MHAGENSLHGLTSNGDLGKDIGSGNLAPPFHVRVPSISASGMAAASRIARSTALLIPLTHRVPNTCHSLIARESRSRARLYISQSARTPITATYFTAHATSARALPCLANSTQATAQVASNDNGPALPEKPAVAAFTSS